MLMGTENDRQAPARGWIFYDGSCHHCVAAVKRSERWWERRGFASLPLQTPWVQARLQLDPSARPEEMRVLTVDGQDFGGARAVVYLARQIWWAWPFYALAQLPVMHLLVDKSYRWIAANRGCSSSACVSRS